MTDAQQALAQVREALAAGPTPGEWRYIVDDGDRKLTAEVSGSFMCDTAYYPWCPDNEGDWKLIAACSPPNIAAILAHVDAQAAENERLTAERDDLRRQLDEAEQDARRYRWLRKFARQNTAYDVYKDGAHWSVGLHSDDHRQTFDQAIDAAMGASNE